MIKTLPIEDLRPNPYRELDSYYFDSQVIEELKESMTRNGVWAGIRAREKDGSYEIAFGHHRLEAMKQLGVTEAIVDVQEIDDLHMLMEMADENMADKRPNTKGITNVVGAAKNKLEEILQDVDTWEDLQGNPNRNVTSEIFKDKASFGSWVGKGRNVGEATLTRFLGDRWNSNIKEALALFKKEEEGKINLKAVLKFDTIAHADTFADIVVKHDIPVETQEEYADELIDDMKTIVSEEDKEKGREGEITSRRIRVMADINHSGRTMHEVKPDIEETLDRYIDRLQGMTAGMEEILDNWDRVFAGSRQRYLIVFKEFVELHTNVFSKEEEESWKQLLLTK